MYGIDVRMGFRMPTHFLCAKFAGFMVVTLANMIVLIANSYPTFRIRTRLLYYSIWGISLSHSLFRSLLMSQGDSESVPYHSGYPAGPGTQLRDPRGLNQSCGDARDPNLTSSSSCAQVRQYRIPECSEFMKFSVRIPILNLQKYSAQVRFTS